MAVTTPISQVDKAIRLTDPVEGAAAVTVGVVKSSRPRVDQFCIYNTSSET